MVRFLKKVGTVTTFFGVSNMGRRRKVKVSLALDVGLLGLLMRLEVLLVEAVLLSFLLGRV